MGECQANTGSLATSFPFALGGLWSRREYNLKENLDLFGGLLGKERMCLTPFARRNCWKSADTNCGEERERKGVGCQGCSPREFLDSSGTHPSWVWGRGGLGIMGVGLFWESGVVMTRRLV